MQWIYQLNTARVVRGDKVRVMAGLVVPSNGDARPAPGISVGLLAQTLASLENALAQFPGCVVVTAHNRWFLDRLATHILAWERTETIPAQWFWLEGGNFACYAQNKVSRLGAEAARPHRATHSKLIRG